MAGSGADKSTVVKAEGWEFDLAAQFDWIADNIAIFLLIALVAFVFYIFQKGGFAEKFLEYRTRKQELEAKQLDDLVKLANIANSKYDRDDPLLPFDDDMTQKK